MTAAVLCASFLAASPSGSNGLQLLAARVSERIAPKAEGPIAISVTGDTPQLASALSTLISSELALRHLGPFPTRGTGLDAEAEARANEAKTLLRLWVGFEGDQLVTRGDLVGTWVNFWAGRAPTRPSSPAMAVFAAVPADNTTLSWRPNWEQPVSNRKERLRLEPQPLAVLPSWTSALGVGDVQGTGHPQIVALTYEDLLLLGPNGNVLGRHSLSDLPLSPTPTREAFGLIYVSPAHELGFLSGMHAHGEWLRWDSALRQLVPQGPAVQELPVCGPKSAARIVPGENMLTVVRGPSEKPLSFLMGCASFDRGVVSQTLAIFADGTGDLAGTPFQALGAGTALADLTGSGRAEVVTSLHAFFPETDEVRVPSEKDLGAVSVPGRVIQAVAADLDGTGRDSVILGVWMPDGTTQLRLLHLGPL